MRSNGEVASWGRQTAAWIAQRPEWSPVANLFSTAVLGRRPAEINKEESRSRVNFVGCFWRDPTEWHFECLPWIFSANETGWAIDFIESYLG